MFLAIRTPWISPGVAGFLFENQYKWWALGAVAGVILLVVARRREDARLLKGAIGVLGAVAVWVLAAVVFVTPAERLYASHVGMAEAAQRNDVPGILNYFDKKFTLTALAITSDTSQDAARDAVAAALKEFRVKSNTFAGFKPVLSADRTATTHFIAWTDVESEQFKGMVKSEWTLTWTDVPGDDWRVQNATLLKLQDESVDTLMRMK